MSTPPMASVPPHLSLADWQRICDALRYLGRDLHHRSFAVSSERRELLWEEMDQCLALADRLAEALVVGPAGELAVDPLVLASEGP
ncbi:MAG: hypothetical protein VKP70_05180 [Cyanobacteriota bacterium]|nr:hypothetical protein [Cyanobacteriota bacterium]